MRICLLVSVVLGITAGLLARQYLPVDSFWVHVIIGITAGIFIFCVIRIIISKGKQSS